MLEIISFGALLIAATSYYYLHRNPDTYRTFDISQLRWKFLSHVYGQHIAGDRVPRALDRYFQTYHLHYQPLFLAFHGARGVGKNYMAQMILDFFPQKTEIIFTAERDFPHEDFAWSYAREVERRIVTTVSKYHVNIIIFDEVERIHEDIFARLLSVLQRLEERTHIPVIVLLLSNANTQAINNMVFEGKLPRETLTQSNFDFIQKASSWYPTNVVVVPFLPLEEQHVIECIKTDLRLKHTRPTQTIIRSVIEELSFHKQNGINYSVTGCKRVSDKVDFVV